MMEERRSTERRDLRKLFKSNSERMVDGVCSGIADYVAIDPAVVRLALVAVTIENLAAGIVFYVTAMILTPARIPTAANLNENLKEPYRKKGSDAMFLIGVIVAVAGILFLFDHNVLSLTSTPLFGFFNLRSIGRLVLPIVLILLGSLLMMGKRRESHGETDGKQSYQTPELSSGLATSTEDRRLSRSVGDKKMAGVCGGIGEFLHVGSTAVRLTFVLLLLASFRTEIIVYFMFALVIPRPEPNVQEAD